MERALGVVVLSGMGSPQCVPALVGTLFVLERAVVPSPQMEDGGLLLLIAFIRSRADSLRSHVILHE